MWSGQSKFYEIWFLVLFEPALSRAYWLRYSILAPTAGLDEPRRALLWAAAFDARSSPPIVASKALLPIEAFDPGPEDRFHIRLGPAELGHGFCRGEVASAKHTITWDLRFEPAERAESRMPKLLHALPLPTRAEHANCDIAFAGSITVDGDRREIHAAPGLQKHIHGTKRVEELRWIYGARFQEDDRASLEVVSARAPRSPKGLKGPGATSLFLRTQEGDIDHTELPGALRHELASPGLRLLHARSKSPTRAVIARAYCDPRSLVGYVYRDPSGSDLHVAQTDIGSSIVEIFERPHPLAPFRPTRRLTSHHATALEFHGPEPLSGARYIPWDSADFELAPRIELPPEEPLPATPPIEGGKLMPLPEPQGIYALGLTYREHVRETGGRPSEDRGPAVFRKERASFLPEGDAVRIPESRQMIDALDALEPGLGEVLRRELGFLPAMLDYEVELGLVLLEDASLRALESPSFAPRIGYFVAGDVTARSCQVLGEGRPDSMRYWSLAKSFPGFLPVGARMWIPSRPDPDTALRVTLRTRVNGRVRQESSTAELAYTPRQMLLYVARAEGRDLVEGDMILTGTPSGVAFQVPAWKRRIGDRVLDRFGKLRAAIGFYIESPSFLWPGDRVEFEAGILGRRSITITERS